ncbi:MAG: hypothetical protein C0501_31245 [Isosphaera sp.]|nr:hypothetical protein [Isosphaera sp.]
MEQALNTRQVADRLSVGPWRVRYAHAAGHVLEPPRVDGVRRYGPDDVGRLERYFAAKRPPEAVRYAELGGVTYRVWANKKGYACVTLTDQAKRWPCLPHRLVYEEHHGPVPAGHDVHHRDGDRGNYAPGNLVALDRAAHREHHRRLKSTDAVRAAGAHPDGGSCRTAVPAPAAGERLPTAPDGVRRMVLAAGRAVLRDHHAAKDACQATSLAPARQAGAVGRCGSAAG